MPRPYSTDLRERARLACEQDEGSFSAVARRFRVGVSTLRLWREQARDGQRAPQRLGRTPAPLDGELLGLNEIVAERNDATLAEYADMLAARTGKPRRSAPALCRALKRLGWVRKQRRCGPANKIVWTWRRDEQRGATRLPGSTPSGSSSWTRAAAIRA